MNNLDALAKYLNSQNITEANLKLAVRRADPLDKAAGAHIAQQGDIDVFVDDLNAIIYKVGPLDKLPKYLVDWRVSNLAHQNGVKVASPITKPKSFGGKAIYATELVPNKYNTSPTPQSVAKVLNNLHSVTASTNIPIATSNLRSLALKVMQDNKTPLSLKLAIKQRALPCIGFVEKDMQKHSTLVHGDTHLGNILVTKPTPTLIDFEDAGRGSPLWDIAVLVQSATRFGLNNVWLKQMVKTWLESSVVSDDNLQSYIDWRCWYGVLSMYIRVQEGRGDSKELQTRMRWVKDPSDKSKWKRC